MAECLRFGFNQTGQINIYYEKAFFWIQNVSQCCALQLDADCMHVVLALFIHFVKLHLVSNLQRI